MATRIPSLPNIFRSRIYEDVVQKLATVPLPDSERRLFPTIREVLCFAALLGFSEQRRLPLDRSQGVEDVSYQQFERDQNAEFLVFLIALAEEGGADVLREGREQDCATVFEEYANGGLAIIKDHLLRAGGEYPDRALMGLLRERGYLVPTQAEPDLAKISF